MTILYQTWPLDIMWFLKMTTLYQTVAIVAYNVASENDYPFPDSGSKLSGYLGMSMGAKGSVISSSTVFLPTLFSWGNHSGV